MGYLVIVALIAALAVAQQTPIIGSSGYTEQQTLLNATEKQSVSDVIEYAVKRAGISSSLVVMHVFRQPLVRNFLVFVYPDLLISKYFERWTNETLKRRAADQRQSYELPIIFGALYHLTLVALRGEGFSDIFYEVSVHRDRNKLLTIIRYSLSQSRAPPEPGAASTSPLTILSWNLWNFNRPWRERVRMLATDVRKYMPAVIGFQEARYDPIASPFAGRWFQVDHLAELLPEYQFVYQPAMLYLEHGDPPGHVDEGLAVFSLYPIVEVSHLRLSRDRGDSGDDHQRILLRARIRTPQGDLNFYVTHLSLSLPARERTASEVWNYIKQHGEAGVIVGDFNEEPDGPMVAHLVGKGGDFVDTWVSAHPGDVGWTFSSDRPRKRIDFVLARCPGSKLAVSNATIIGTASLSLSGETVFASDHFGVLVELQCEAPRKPSGWAVFLNEDYVMTACVGLALALVLSDIAHCYVAVQNL